MINKSASFIGRVELTNGNVIRFWIGANSNTGATIVWHQVNDARAKRATGRNVRDVAECLDHVMREGEGKWVGEVNDAALDALRKEL